MIGMTYGYLVILKALSRCILPSSYMDLKLLSYRGSESLKSTLALNKPRVRHYMDNLWVIYWNKHTSVV